MSPVVKVLFLTMALSSFLAGCTVGPDFASPPAPDAKRYTETDLPDKTASASAKEGAAQSFAPGQDAPANWWTLFGSDDLNQLVQLSLKNNPDLQAANAALTQAHENYLSTVGDILPSVDANFQPAREKFNPAAFGQNGVPSSIFTLYNASVSASYGLDLFGGTRRYIEEAHAQANYQRYERDAAYMTLTANVVTAAIQEASLREQIAETQNILDAQTKELNILNTQFQLGGIAKSVVLQQQTLVAQTQTTLPQLQKQLAQQRNQLSILVGKLPSDGPGASFTLDKLKLPESLPVSLPSKLVEQRPDIRAAEEQLHAASAAVGVATAQMLPQITLNASYGYENISFHNLLKTSSSVWSVGGDVLQPLFHGGELLHNRRATEAQLEKAQAQYQSTVLQAFANVANTLKALQYDAESLASQVSAVQAAESSLNLTQEQFKAGAISYPQLLQVQQSYQQARIGLAQAEAARLADTAALFQALGGSWHDPEELAKSAEVLKTPLSANQTPAPAAPQNTNQSTPLTPFLDEPVTPSTTPAPAEKPLITPITNPAASVPVAKTPNSNMLPNSIPIPTTQTPAKTENPS